MTKQLSKQAATEWENMVKYSKEGAEGSCPLVEDYTIIDVDKYIKQLESKLQFSNFVLCVVFVMNFFLTLLVAGLPSGNIPYIVLTLYGGLTIFYSFKMLYYNIKESEA